MNRYHEFTFCTLAKEEETSLIFEGIGQSLGVYTQALLDKELFLNKLLEAKPHLIAFHTNIGKSVLLKTLKEMKEEKISPNTPIIIISDLDDTSELSLELEVFNVISIFCYENWEIQLTKLLKYLGKIELGLNDTDADTEEDSLTGLLKETCVSRIFHSLEHEQQHSKRPFSLISFYIDDYEKIAKEQGQDIADEVIVSISSIAKLNVRRYDTVFRLKEDTFAIFLSGANQEIAMTKAESFRYEIELKGHGFDKLKVTASFVVQEYSEGESFEEFDEKIKNLFIQVQGKGKNQVFRGALK